MARYFIKKWDEFQHYRDRSPPWLKLHRTLLDDYDFQCLPIASKALAPMIWLIASESRDGGVECDIARLAFRLRWSEKDVAEGLTPLINNGFLMPASGVLAERLQDARPETEGETETETETEGEGEAEKDSQANACVDMPAEKTPACPPCPIDEIIKTYHATLPELPKFIVRNETRDGYIRSRWREFFAAGEFVDKGGGLDCFRWLFSEKVKPSRFLTGKAEGRPGKKPFVADLEWLMRPTNFAKVIEGKYA